MRTGHFVERYETHVGLSDNPVVWTWLGVLVVALLVFPFVASSYLLLLATTIGIAAIGAIGLNILTAWQGRYRWGRRGSLPLAAMRQRS